jgi:N-methylhydantoinase B
MGIALRRTAYSANIKERMDASCAIFDEKGRLLAQAEHIPVHLGSMPLTVQFVLENLGSKLYEGDQLLTNDPFLGGSHIPDITVVKPVYRSRVLVGFTANRAHHADMGGSAPGSMPGISTDIYQEGFRLPPCKIIEKGEENKDILKILKANTRTPDERMGDLRAQFAANNVGSERLDRFITKHGKKQFKLLLNDLIGYSGRRMKEAINEIPAGTYSAIEYLDDDGVSEAPIELKVRIQVKNQELKFDFTGTSAQTSGNLNAPYAVTAAAVYYCVRCVTDPTIPVNYGCFEPITIIVPGGTMLNPGYASAVSAGNVETSQRIVDLIFLALGDVLSHKLGGQSQGTMNNLIIGGLKPSGGEFSYYETIGGGEGGLPFRRGQDGIQVHMTNTANTPVEALESVYPLQVESYELITGSGGRGINRGGMGIRRAVKVLSDDAVLSIQSERRKFAPKGARGGLPGRCGKNYLIRDGKKIKLPSKVVSRLEQNDIIVIETPGGGGYGKKKKS